VPCVLSTGLCGAWLFGDLNGISAQQIQDTVNDIMACGGLPVQAIDHNCYSPDRTKVSFKKCHKVGAKWVNARKYWQGILGINDRNDPTPIVSVSCTTGSTDGNVQNPPAGMWSTVTGFNNVAPQVRYRTAAITSLTMERVVSIWDPTDPEQNGRPGTSIRTVSGASTVGRYTGIQTYSLGNVLSYTPDPAYTPVGDVNPWVDAGGLFAQIVGWDHDAIILYFIAQFQNYPLLVSDGGVSGVVTGGGTSWTWTFGTDDGEGNVTNATAVVVISSGSCSLTTHYLQTSVVETVVKTVEAYDTTESATWGNTLLSYGYSEAAASSEGTIYTQTNAATLALTDPYTSADCYADWLALADAWNMTSDTIYPYRMDEELANAPLVVFDEVEVGPTEPQPTMATVNDYTQAQNEDSTWPQRTYFDPTGFMWVGLDGSVNNSNVAGSHLAGPLYSGAIVSHNAAGSDEHFWFAAQNWLRWNDTVSDDGGWVWSCISHGGTFDGSLPATAMRWMNRFESQYDSGAQYGNLPNSWLREKDAIMVGGKYVEAKEIWQSVNFARPYGLDKFAVDQTTVCAVNSGSGSSGSLNVTKTNNAATPLLGGLVASGNVMIGGDGVYSVTGCTDNGDGSFTLSVGTRLGDIPTGADIGEGYVGMMRFWTAPPFGVLDCAAWWDGTANTNFVMPATPYWLAASGNPTLLVDCYAPDASNRNPHAQVGSTATLTKYGAWEASTDYVTGQKILVGQTIQTATTGGTSNGIAPTWNPTVGGTTSDDEVTWTTGGTVPVGAVAYAVGNFTTAAFLCPHLLYSVGTQLRTTDNVFKPEYDDNRPKGDFVQVQWGFNIRAVQTTPAPGYTGPAVAWNGAGLSAPQPGVMPAQVLDANIRMSPCCPAVVGFVPFYSPPADTGSGPAHTGGSLPPPPVPLESFRNQKLFDFPGTFLFDDAFGAFWMGAAPTAMVDPFWQPPFAPETAASSPQFQWSSDDGSGLADIAGDPDSDPPIPMVKYYPAPPLVEARATYPANLGWLKNETAPILPTGITLPYDPTTNVVTADFADGLPTGIPTPPNGDGSYGDVATIYGFYLAACRTIAANTPVFADAYKKFTSC
jgi:hypothetical protein